jgi:chitin disaccharide deacetylase
MTAAWTRGRRQLIVNADDLGQSAGVNLGIAEAVEHGIVTSTSLMVRWPAAEGAARWARAHPGVSVGLHIDLGEWTYSGGQWRQLYEVCAGEDPGAVEAELRRQSSRFIELIGRCPTHLDSHQHVHRDEPVRSLVLAIAEELEVPVRQLTPTATYCGAFYGQSGRGDPYPEGITYGALLDVLDGLEEGVTELGCHPGADDLSDVDSMYLAERPLERSVLCDGRLPAALSERSIELCSFLDTAPRQG